MVVVLINLHENHILLTILLLNWFGALAGIVGKEIDPQNKPIKFLVPLSSIDF